MKLTQKQSGGFTLIEVIVSLLLLGIITVIAGFGTSKVVEGYLTTSENSKTSTNVQVALARLEKEFSVILVKKGVSAATSITFIRYGKKGEEEIHTLSWSGTSGHSLELDGNSLLDNVTDFNLSYLDAYDDPTPNSTWKDGTSGTSGTRIIGISVTVSGALGIPSTFSTRITPRNL